MFKVQFPDRRWRWKLNVVDLKAPLIDWTLIHLIVIIYWCHICDAELQRFLLPSPPFHLHSQSSRERSDGEGCESTSNHCILLHLPYRNWRLLRIESQFVQTTDQFSCDGGPRGDSSAGASIGQSHDSCPNSPHHAFSHSSRQSGTSRPVSWCKHIYTNILCIETHVSPWFTQ